MPQAEHEPPQEQEDFPFFLFFISCTIIETKITAIIVATIIVGIFIGLNPRFLDSVTSNSWCLWGELAKHL